MRAGHCVRLASGSAGIPGHRFADMRERGLEPPRDFTPTSTSSWRVCQFRHSRLGEAGQDTRPCSHKQAAKDLCRPRGVEIPPRPHRRFSAYFAGMPLNRPSDLDTVSVSPVISSGSLEVQPTGGGRQIVCGRNDWDAGRQVCGDQLPEQFAIERSLASVGSPHCIAIQILQDE